MYLVKGYVRFFESAHPHPITFGIMSVILTSNSKKFCGLV